VNHALAAIVETIEDIQHFEFGLIAFGKPDAIFSRAGVLHSSAWQPEAEPERAHYCCNHQRSFHDLFLSWLRMVKPSEQNLDGQIDQAGITRLIERLPKLCATRKSQARGFLTVWPLLSER